ncbi:MAG: MBL fold metallo-hydrolase [Sulfuriferula multivorans]|uniref:MBL fold metallo-hydrolase n=1 Tax=Sulfuriferula multivorans TaxID=1559896 RepID=A0A7C9K8L1_9PROT|nr:MBL fold metallo-hydrolase [Sulfuriferula multivorans]
MHTLRIFLAVWMLSLINPALALTLKPQRVAPGVYALVGEVDGRTYDNEGMNATTGFVVTTAGVVVIDSGSSYRVGKQIHDAIRHVTQQPVKYVINTGGQDHRWLGNSYFVTLGVPIIGHEKMRADAEERGVMQIQSLQGELKEKLDGTRVVLPTQTFATRHRLRLGTTDFELIFTAPAHTPGDILVWLPQTRTVFSGDIVFADRLLGVWPFSNVAGWIASFDALAALKPEHIVPGHGGVCDLAQARRETRDYLALLRDHMKRAIDAGEDLQTALATLDQSAYSNLANFDLLSGGNASRAYLEAEAAAF